MKKILLFLLTTLLFVSCQDYDYLASKSSKVIVEGDGGSRKIKLSFSQPWSVGNIPEWISVSPSSGRPKKANDIDSAEVIITVKANDSGTTRSQIITFNTAKSSLQVTVSQGVIPTKDGRNVLAYFAACNNLYNFAFDDINEMELGWDENCNGQLFVLFNKYSGKPDLNGESDLILISYDDDPKKINSQVIKTYSKSENPNDPTFIRKVLDYVDELYPAKSRGLVLWSHGSGWLPQKTYYPYKNAPANPLSKIDFAMADLNSSSPSGGEGQSFSFGDGNTLKYPSLEVYQLNEALEGLKFDFIYFDACYMGCIEVAYELRDKTEYFMASVSETLATGAPYDVITPFMFESNLNMNKIAQSCFDYYNEQTGEVRSSTYGVVKSSKLDALAAATKAVLTKKTPTSTGIQQFGRSPYNDIFFDFEQFITARWGTSPNLAGFKAALNEAIVFKAATPVLFEGNNQIIVNKHCGVSVYIPKSSQPSTLKTYRERYSWSNNSGLGKLF